MPAATPVTAAQLRSVAPAAAAAVVVRLTVDWA